MRITTKIAAGGHRSLTRIPFPHCWVADCLDESGKIDRVKSQLAFACPDDADYNPFMPSSGDDETVYFAVLTFFEQLHDAYQSLVKRTDSDVSEGSKCKQDDKNIAKFDRGKFVYATMDVKRTSAGCRVRLSVGNPHGIVGEAEAEAMAYLRTCAQLWLRMSDTVKWLEIEESEIVDEAREANAAADLRFINDQRFSCERRTATGYCSPCKFDCPHCKGGKCEELAK